MDDRSLVAALRSGDVNGLAGVYDAYADRLLAYAVTLLRDRDAGADAVHDALLVARERVGQLRDPDRLRPWLYAIVRNECLRQLRDRKRSAPLDAAGDVIDDRADAGSGAREAELRELVWSAAAALNPGEREVLELSVRHGLEGADLAAALGTGLNQAHAMSSRARAQLEKSLGALLVARSERGRCADLDALLAGWDGTLTPLLRKRLARHVDRCEVCGETKRHRLNPVALLAGTPFLLAPSALRDRVLTDARLVSSQSAAGTSDAAAPDPAGGGPTGGGPGGAGGKRRAGVAASGLGVALALRAGPWKPDGFPRALQRVDRRRGWWVPPAAAAVVLALLLGLGLTLRPGADPTPLADDGPLATGTLTAAGTLPVPAEEPAGPTQQATTRPATTPAPTTTTTTATTRPAATPTPTDPADTTAPTRVPTRNPTTTRPPPVVPTPKPTPTRTPPPPLPDPAVSLAYAPVRTSCATGAWTAQLTATVTNATATSVVATVTTARGTQQPVPMTGKGGTWTGVVTLRTNQPFTATATAATPRGTATSPAIALRRNCRT